MHVQEDLGRIDSPAIRECFILQGEILRHLSPEALHQRPNLKDSLLDPTLSSLAFGSAFYGLDVPPSVSRNHTATPLISVVEQSFAFSQLCAQAVVRQRGISSSLRASYSHVLSLLQKLVEFAEKSSNVSFKISWNPSLWVGDILDSLDVEVRTFLLTLHCKLNFTFRTSISIWLTAVSLSFCHFSSRPSLPQASFLTKSK